MVPEIGARLLRWALRYAFWISALAQLIVFLLLPIRPKPFGDRWFHEDASALVAALKGGATWSEVQVRHAPGPVLYYAVAYLWVPAAESGDLERHQYSAGVALNLGVLVFSLFLVWRAAILSGGLVAGAVAALLLAVNPIIPYYAWGILAEPPAYGGAALIAYAWARLSRRPAPSPAVWIATAAFGCTALIACRPNAILLVPLLGLLSLVPRLWGDERGQEVRRASLATAGLAMILCAALLIAPRLLFGGSNQQGVLGWVALHGSFQFRNDPLDWRYWDDAVRGGSTDYQAWRTTNDQIVERANRTGQSVDLARLRWVINDFLTNPHLRLQMGVVRALYSHVWVAHSASPHEFRLGPLRGSLAFYAVHGALNLSLWAAVVCFLGLCWKSRADLAAHWGLWAPWLSLLIFASLVYAEPRYLYPGLPGVYVGAGQLVSGWLRKLG